MTKQEEEFLKNLKYKLDHYKIKKDGKLLSVRDCLPYARGQFVKAHYNNGEPDELIDIGIEKFLYKCSPLLFLEKYGMFELPGIGEISCKNLYYFQKEILKDFLNWKKIVLTKSRQTGMSTLISLIFFWKAVNFNDEWLLIISRDGKSSQDFLAKIKLNFKNIPQWFGLKIIKNNVKGVEFSNRTKIDSFARGKDAARGCSGTMVVCDEFAFYQTKKIAEGIVSSVTPSLSRVGGTLMIISTPNGTVGEGEPYYNQVNSLREKGGTDGEAKLYTVDWWEVPDGYGIKPEKGFNAKVQSFIDRDYFNNPAVRLEAENFFRPIAEKPKENAWLNFQYTTSGEVKYRQEILQDFIVVGDSVFDKLRIDSTQKKVMVPIKKDYCGNKPLKNLWIWKEPIPDHKYIVSVDVSKGSGDDDSAIQVVDMSTYEQVAEYCGKCTTIDLARYVYDIGKWYNWAYTIVESNSIGETTFTILYYDLNYPNLFKQKKNKNGVEVMTGWITNAKTRELITSKFIDYYYDDEMWKEYTPHSSRMLEQMKTWVWKNGRPDHSGNSHDDTIMAMAIGLYNIADGLKKIRHPEDVLFFDENGVGVSIAQESENSLTNRYINSKTYNGSLDENQVRNIERDLYKQAGLNPYSPESADIYKWLIS